jgi:tetratricopeptide (TPR) repeat protein
MEVLDMSTVNSCVRIVTALLLIGSLSAVGCGREHSRDAEGQVTKAVAPAPAPAPVQPAPVAPVIAPEPVVVQVVEPEPPVMAEPDEPENLLAAANAAAARGDCEKALEYVRRFRSDQPENLMLRIREAGLSNECGQPQHAIDLLIDLDANTRALEPVTAELADAYLMTNRPGKAAMTWELRFIVDETAWDAAVHAASSWLEADQYDTAQWWFEQARAAAPDSPEVEVLAVMFESDDN